MSKQQKHIRRKTDDDQKLGFEHDENSHNRKKYKKKHATNEFDDNNDSLDHSTSPNHIEELNSNVNNNYNLIDGSLSSITQNEIDTDSSADNNILNNYESVEAETLSMSSNNDSSSDEDNISSDNSEPLLTTDYFNDLPNDRNLLKSLRDALVIATQKGADSALSQKFSRRKLVNQLSAVCSKYYGYNSDIVSYILDLFGTKNGIEFFNSNETARPVTLRVNYIKTRRKELAMKLIARGCNVSPIGDWSKTGLIVNQSSIPIGATPEYLAGHYIIMSASSFLPVLALDPQPNEVCVDVAAAPGGKAGFIAERMKNTGILFANDINKTRLPALTANLHRLGVRNAIITCYDGTQMKKHITKKVDRVLIDAPCSGSGVFYKSPEAKIRRKPEEFIKLAETQKMLLLNAIDMVDADSKSSGIIVYSTCSIAVEENELVVDYALRKRKVKLVDTSISFGTNGFTSYKKHRFNPSLSLTKRFYPHKNNMDGFFVAKFKKLKN